MHRHIRLTLLLCGLFLLALPALAQDDDAESTPEPTDEPLQGIIITRDGGATAEATAEPLQGVIITRDDAEPELDDEEVVAEAEENEAEADEALVEAEVVDVDLEEAEEETADGTGLLVLLMGLGGIGAVGLAMIGRAQNENESTT